MNILTESLRKTIGALALTIFCISSIPTIAQAMPQNDAEFQAQVNQLSEAQLQELQDRVANFQVANPETKSIEEIREEYTAFIAKTVNELATS